MSHKKSSLFKVIINPSTSSFDLPLEEMTINLTPPEELNQYQLEQRKLSSRYQGKVMAFPHWRRHKRQAERVLSLYHRLPWCRRLPLKLSCLLADIIMR